MTPAEGYGQRNTKRVVSLPLNTAGDLTGLRVGMRIKMNIGSKNAFFTVTNKSSEEIVLDGNHPLAGLTLLINVEVVNVREATHAELNELGSNMTGKTNEHLFLSPHLQEAV